VLIKELMDEGCHGTNKDGTVEEKVKVCFAYKLHLIRRGDYV
jgi:hypothetical protein